MNTVMLLVILAFVKYYFSEKHLSLIEPKGHKTAEK